MSFFEFPHTRTYDSDLGWIIKDDMKQDEAIELIKQWIAETQPTIEELEELYNDIIVGDLPSGMIEGIRIWMENNALDLVGGMIKHVYFGLTNDGYFCAYIPDNWSDIQFDTITDEDDPLYGHLVLMYD